MIKKIISLLQKEPKQPVIYDVILFNFEGEKRVDIITSIETHKVVDSYTKVYGTCAHGLINDVSIERNLGTIC